MIKSFFILLIVSLSISGCDHPTPSPYKQPGITSEAVVVFKKGLSVDRAKRIVGDYGFEVVKVYEKISQSSHMPMLHIRSNLPMREMLHLLKSDPRVHSVSPNYRRTLDR